MRRFTIMFFFLLFAVSCNYRDSADGKQAAATEKSLAEANRQIGMPNITNFTERKLAKMILELRDNPKLATFTYIINRDGERIFLCNSIGYGLPYAVQFTNPSKLAYSRGGSLVTMPQADPNGLFMPDALSATWVIMATKDGPQPLYVEPQILVSPVKMH